MKYTVKLTGVALMFALAVLSVSSPADAADRVTYLLVPKESSLHWTGRKVTGRHEGTVAIKDGSGVFENGRLIGGEVRVDMRTIAVDDIKDEKNNLKLTTHLRSDDFFAVAVHPESYLRIRKAEPILGAPAGAANYRIDADISIVGISRPISFPARIDLTGDEARGSATIELDRTLYNIRYGSGKFFENLGDKMIYDTFSVDLNLVATRSGLSS